MVYHFSDIPRSTRAIFKFQKLGSSEDFDISTLGSVSLRSGFDGCRLGLNLYRQQWEAALNVAWCKSAMAESLYISIHTAHL